ncbi:hypothetical protein PANT_6c00025 [Moesziomyces antarcticus T-34]|uniref:C2H2-type domain-containing protein n=1 Tax=Pseudozyma antarctica (strain T-34) TaxID=1151754 RepID=M9LKM5_PSEA3|nr:hypothetical protein PANT_6c00025 [Moesziomyces antarcticus T-34]
MPKTISCPHAGCDYLFSKPVHLRRHLLSHSDEAVWKCPDCDQEFKRIDSFQRHKKRIHPDQPNLAAVRIGGDADADSSAKSDDEADDQIDDLDISMRDDDAKPFISVKRGATSPLSRGATASASATSHQMSSYNTPSALSNQRSSGSNYSSPSSSRHHGLAAATEPTTSMYTRAHHYHPYQRSDSAPQAAQSNNGDSSAVSHSQWPSQPAQSSMYDSNNAAASSSFSFYPNLYGAPISYNGYAAASSSSAGADALAVANTYGSAASGDASQTAAPLSIASLTAPSPSWGSSNSDTEAQTFFDDILQSILMDSISTFVPHETVGAPDLHNLTGAAITQDAFGFGDAGSAGQVMPSAQNSLTVQQPSQQTQHQTQPPSAVAQQEQHQQQPAPPQQDQNQGQSAQSAEVQSATTTSGSQQQQPPQPLVNLVPFATFTESAHNSGRSTPATPRHAHAGMDDADEMTRSVEKVGDQAATNIGARTRDLVLHGVNIPKKPPRLTAASLFSAATRHTRSMLPLLPSYWLLDHRRLAAERPYVFISLLALGTLWQPRADVKAYGAELWQLIFRSIWAGAVFYLDQPQLMREATAVMAYTHLYAFMCRDENIRRKSIHSTYTGSSLIREYGWRQGVWFLVGPWEESLQRVLGANIQMALVELEVLARDQSTNRLSAEQKRLLDRLHGVWKQWSDAEEVNRNMICHGITESHHSEFLTSHGQMRSMGRITCQALVPSADDVWDAKTAIEWARLVLEHKSRRENHQRPLLSGKRQLGPILDALWGVDAPSPATAKRRDSGESGELDSLEAKRELQRMLCFTIKEHFALLTLLEGLHLLWIARYMPPFRTGTSYAADFSPSQPTFAPGIESAFCIKGGTAYHHLNVLDNEMMLAALSRWMRLCHQSYLPNPVANGTGFSQPISSDGPSTAADKSGSSTDAGVAAKPGVQSIGPINDRFQLHFRFHVIQLSVLFNAHHVVHALVSSCGNEEANGVGQGGKAAAVRAGMQTAVPLRCESCTDADMCPYRNARLQRWAALHAGAVIGNFMSMPRLSNVTPTILEGLGQAFGILVILCRLQRPLAQRRRTVCRCDAEVREGSVELISDQCLHLDAERPSPGEGVKEKASAKFESSSDCWLQHGTLDEGAMLLGQPIQEWAFVLQDMGNELKSVAGTWQTAEEFLAVSQKMLNSFTFYVE